MSFGQKILAKYGYKEGAGLGKHEDGITAPIKANFKFDTAGLGDSGPVKDDHWWERVFNEATNNVNVQKTKSGEIAMELHDKEGVEVTNRSFSRKKLKESNGSLQYGSFLKSATLLANVGTEEEIEGHLSTGDIEIKQIQIISDEDLFKACGGRTAHKGARHGLNLNGKLKRIAEQEKLLLEKMKNKQNRHEVFREPYAKKREDDLLNSSIEDNDGNLPLVDPDTDYILKDSTKRRKRDRRNENNLAAKVNEIGLEEKPSPLKNVTEFRTSKLKRAKKSNKHETIDESPKKNIAQDETQDREGTPIRKKKQKSKKIKTLDAISETESVPESSKRKKKKSKRKLEEIDVELTAKKVKLEDSFEASADEIDRLNSERRHKKTSKLSRKRKIKHEQQTDKVTKLLENL